jgi:hypothetical protein
MKAFLDESNLPGEEVPSRAAIRVPFSGSHGEWLCVARARERQQQFVFYSIAPVEIQPGMRAAASEFFHRVNFDLIFGNFEIDLDDGEVRFKTCIDCQDTELTEALMKPVVIANVSMMDKYLPAIRAVNEGMAPSDAVAMVEGASAKNSILSSAPTTL